METNRVLIVDDEEGVRKLLGRILEAAHMDVYAAPDGKTALALASSCKPALVILDMGLPDMDGGEVLRRIKSQETTRDVPVMILTGMLDVPAGACGLENGADAFMLKPFLSGEMMARVNALLYHGPGPHAPARQDAQVAGGAP
ncbi:MAG: response regulator transcription factor [Elusimicrobia bacterium]|nr:response regulator transcription factor [Elusimicrobiota bacterium]